MNIFNNTVAVPIISTVDSTGFLSSKIDGGSPFPAATLNPVAVPCVRGTKIGQILVTQPNSSSLLFTDSPSGAIIQWTYTPLVKKFPSRVCSVL